jgi:putative MATE family efflux protein
MSYANAKNGDFGEGKVSSLIMSQAVPLTLAQLVQVVYNIVDRMYIGHMPGDEAGVALTGVGVTFPLITLVAAFTNLFATGGAPLCSIARGHGNEEKAKNIEAQTLTMQILVGLVIMCTLYIVRKPALYMLGASDITYGYANSYISIYLLGTVFMMVGTGMNGFINLQGFPRMGMLSTMLGAAVNIVLDPIFIFGLNLGVRGAAIATVISQFCSACFVIHFLFGKNVVIRITVKDMLHLDLKLLGEIVTLGMSGFIMGATNCIVQAVCNATLSIHGGDIYIGVMTIINSVREMISLPINGVTSGSQPVLGYNYGAGNADRVKQGIRFAAKVALLYTFTFWILVISFPSFFIGLFSSDAEILTTGILPFRVYFAGFIMMTLQFCGQSTFVALGKSKQAIFFSLFRKVIIVVPLTLILPNIASLGVIGVFLAEPISNCIGGLASFLTMIVTVYRKL